MKQQMRFYIQWAFRAYPEKGEIKPITQLSKKHLRVNVEHHKQKIQNRIQTTDWGGDPCHPK